jgi:single-stranded-DNA-specific exonuclease
MGNWKIREFDKGKEKAFLDAGIKPFVARLLAQRNIDANNVSDFIDSPYGNLSHPHTLHDVENAAKLFCDVALKKGNIAVIGDYDCDGVLSSVMIKQLCTRFGLKCKVFLPSRINHGYGLTTDALETFKEGLSGSVPDLLFIVDCGSNNEKEVQNLREFGIGKIIIIDHHIIDESKKSKSADALISWHLSGTEEMCTCGEIFQFIRGIRWLTKKVEPIEFLTYAAIGTIADVSPLLGDNRIIVKNGLSKDALNHLTSVGFNSLMRTSGLYSDAVTQKDIQFQIAPKINAAGRLLVPDLAYRLLVETDINVSESMAESLVDCNNKRKKLQKKIEKEAIKMIESEPDSYSHGIAISNYKWHIGVAGIVASKLVEKFYKPVLVIGENNGIYKGSGRSLPNINLKQIMDDCKDCFVKYGGHEQAAGLTLKEDCIDKINDAFNKACEKYYTETEMPEEVNYYDIEVKAKALSIKVAKSLVDTLYPYCNQFNPEPVFCLKDAIISKPEMGGSKIWPLLSFNVSRDGVESEMRLKYFTHEFGTEVDGRSADIYFQFPQNLEGNKFGSPAIDVLDIIFP